MTILSATSTHRPTAATAAPEGEGWFTQMIRLWLEHNARVLEMGGEPF